MHNQCLNRLHNQNAKFEWNLDEGWINKDKWKIDNGWIIWWPIIVGWILSMEKKMFGCLMAHTVAPLLWPSVGVKPNTWKSRELESSGTPECSKLDSKAQNTSPWGVLGIIGKVSKCKCPKWPRIGHLDICSPSYGQKKGRESNWQFDSRPLKVRNRPVPNVRSGSAIRRWKALFEGYKIGSDLVAIRGQGEELWRSKVPGVQPGHIRDNFGTPFRESREFVPFGCSPHGASQSIL
jgi:hypothetical protein